MMRRPVPATFTCFRHDESPAFDEGVETRVPRHHLVRRSPSPRPAEPCGPTCEFGSARYVSLRIATARVHPADAACTLTGKQHTSNPVDGSASRLLNFSIWQYPISRPAL